jgi:DNA-binding SARP family transcriptional activator/predicted ATPase
LSATLAITLLGNPEVSLDGAPVRGFVSSKAAALLYYLAATGRSHAREALAGLLWPEVTDAQASKNLRDVLSNLRRLFDSHLAINRQTVALIDGPALQIDSRRFEQAAAAGGTALREAVELYRGDFLEGFSLAEAPEYEEWALVERERLRQLALGALQQLAAQAGHQGDYAQGIAQLNRLLALDPTREEAHRLLMLLLAMSGQRGAALAQYAACRRALADELGVDPDAATEELHRRILDGAVVGLAQPPAPARAVHQLPAPRALVVGRAAEAAQVAALLADPACRLITITGPGGVGKTCLALYAAHQLLPASRRGAAFADGLAFVALAPLELPPGADPADEQAALPLLAARVADALRFTFAGPEPPQAQLCAYLGEKDLLLVLDNCEHLPVAAFVVELLERAPHLKLLLTSRGRLNVRGERIVVLGGLAFPPAAAERHGVDSYGAVQLFRQAAQAASPGLAWTHAVAAAAARVCELVGGLPLAIELAAGMARLMPVEEIAGELSSSLGFLQSSRRDLPERHQSLQAVFEHSWRLLGDGERRALRQLAVFRGGFARDAAARVAGAPLPLLAALVDNSLVRPVAEPGRPVGRYQQMELVRQYAAEQLDAAGAEAPAAAERHGRYYLQFVSQRAADLRGARQQAAADEIHREIENIRAAWYWAAERGEIELIGAAAAGLFFFDEMRSWFREGHAMFAAAASRVAERAALDDRPAQVVWGGLLARQGWCAFQIGRHAEARALLERSLATLRGCAPDAELVLPLNYLASAAYYGGDYAEAERLAGEALAISQACGDRHGAAVALTVFGQIAALVGRYADARRRSEGSLAIERELGNRWGMVFPLISLGRVAQAQGDYRAAQRYFQEGLAIRQAFGDTRGVALCLELLGDTAAALADHPEAAWFYREALALFQSVGNQSGAVAALVKLGYNALALGDRPRAGGHFRQALRVAWQMGALPRILEALAGVAAALADEDLAQAGALAALVHAHPAATQESRDRAAELLARAPGGQPPAELEPAVLGLLAAG